MLAEFLLGNIYWKGYGIFPINYVLANQYFLKAANHGHAEAARKLGCAYAEKLGVAKVDYTEAIRWWEKAVERENCAAAFFNNDCSSRVIPVFFRRKPNHSTLFSGENAILVFFPELIL